MAKISVATLIVFALTFAAWLNFAPRNNENAHAATTISAMSLINSDEMTATVNWPAGADGEISNIVVIPTKYEISLTPKNTIPAGTTIDFGFISASGKISGVWALQSSQTTLGNLGAFDGRLLTLSRDLAAGQETNIEISPTINSTAHALTSSTNMAYTETFLNSTISRKVPELQVDAATKFGGSKCEMGPHRGIGRVSIRAIRNDQQYQQSVLSGAPDNSRLPAGNYVAVWQIDAENAQNVIGVNINILASYLAAITPDGKNLASRTDNDYPFQVRVEGAVSFRDGFSQIYPAADSPSADLMVNTNAKTWGWARNSDGSITAFMNFGNLADYPAPTENLVRNAVLNQQWAGTESGAQYAYNMWKNGVVTGASLFYGLDFYLADPTVVTTLAGNIQNTEGCDMNMSDKTIVSSAIVEGQTAIKIQYLAKNGAPLAQTTTAYGWPADSYTTPAAPTITGYTFVANGKTDGGIQGSSVGEEVTFPADGTTTLTYVYAPNDESFKVNFVDENGEVLAPQETVAGKFGESWAVSAKAIVGYVVAQSPAQTSGTFTENNADLTFVYKPVANLVDDEKITEFGVPTEVVQLANDEIFGKIARIEVSTPAHGKAVVNDDKTIIYTSNDGFYGEDNFTYTVIFADSSEFSANVKITVATPLCEYDPSILADDASCRPKCEYNENLFADDKTCAPQCEYNPEILANDPECEKPNDDINENLLNKIETTKPIIPTAPNTGISADSSLSFLYRFRFMKAFFLLF